MGLYSCAAPPFHVEKADTVPTAEGPRHALFDPEPQPNPAETEASIPAPDEPEEEDAQVTGAPDHDKTVQNRTNHDISGKFPASPQLAATATPGGCRALRDKWRICRSQHSCPVAPSAWDKTRALMPRESL
jgi:hypothetical protein